MLGARRNARVGLTGGALRRDSWQPIHPRRSPGCSWTTLRIRWISFRFSSSASKYNTLPAGASKLAGNTKALASINQKLQKAEQQFLDPAGLPGRDWYKHLLYAPGFYTGYGVKTMPGVRESIEQKQYKEAETEIVRVAAALMREAAWLDAVAKEIGG